MERSAVCSCGQLSVTVAGEPAFHGLCSCFACQKESGSAFSYSGYWPKSAVQRIEGKSSVWRRGTDTGRWIDKYFCPICGSGVYWYAEFDPDLINLAIGNFTDPTFPPPQYAVWNENKHLWIEIPPDCKSFARQPDTGDNFAREDAR